MLRSASARRRLTFGIVGRDSSSALSAIVDFIMAASEPEVDGIFNVGTGVETSVNAIYTAIARALGLERPAEHGPAKPGEQMRSVLDGTKLRKLAGLPQPVALRDGLTTTVEWLRSRK